MFFRLPVERKRFDMKLTQTEPDRSGVGHVVWHLQDFESNRSVFEICWNGGQIETSDSPCALPMVLVTKKDGSTRFSVDYRRLNASMVNHAYPLPQIDDSLRLLVLYHGFG